MVGKKVKGRKRLIGIDTLGNLLAVLVHACNRSDTKIGVGLCERIQEKYPGIEAFCADEGFRGTCFAFVTETLGMRMDISKSIQKGFAVIKQRWKVERTLAWLNGFRRLAKDFEILPATEENFIRIAMIKITLAKA